MLDSILNGWQHRLRILSVVVGQRTLSRSSLSSQVRLIWKLRVVQNRSHRSIVALVQRLIHTVLSKRVCSVRSLTALVWPIHHVQTVVERVLHHAHWLVHCHLWSLVVVWSCPVREQSLIDLQQSSLIVHKQVQDVWFVLTCEITDLDSVLGKLGQSEKWLFELLGLLRALVKLLELLAIVDLVLEPALHDLFSDFFDALDEERLKFVALCAHIDAICNDFLGLLFLPINDWLQVSNRISVTSLKCLHVLDDFFFDFIGGHTRLEDKIDEFLELNVLRRNISVTASWWARRCSLSDSAFSNDSRWHHFRVDHAWLGSGILSHVQLAYLCSLNRADDAGLVVILVVWGKNLDLRRLLNRLNLRLLHRRVHFGLCHKSVWPSSTCNFLHLQVLVDVWHRNRHRFVKLFNCLFSLFQLALDSADCKLEQLDLPFGLNYLVL